MDTRRHGQTIDTAESDEVVIDETAIVGDAAGAIIAGDAIVVEDDGEDKKAKLPSQAVRNSDGTITLPLKRPVNLTIRNAGGERKETVEALTFHEMTGLDLRLIAQAVPDMQTVVAMAQATKMPVHRMNVLFDKLLGRDVIAATAVISFLQE